MLLTSAFKLIRGYFQHGNAPLNTLIFLASHAPGCGRDLHLQILSSNRVIFLLQPSFKQFLKKKKKTLLYLSLRFVQCEEVAFAGMKGKGIFKDQHKKLEELIFHGTSEQTQQEERFFYFYKFCSLLLFCLMGLSLGSTKNICWLPPGDRKEAK